MLEYFISDTESMRGLTFVSQLLLSESSAIPSSLMSIFNIFIYEIFFLINDIFSSRTFFIALEFFIRNLMSQTMVAALVPMLAIKTFYNKRSNIKNNLFTLLKLRNEAAKYILVL